MRDPDDRTSMMSELRLLAMAAAEAAVEDEPEPIVDAVPEPEVLVISTRQAAVDQAKQAQAFSSMLREAVGR